MRIQLDVDYFSHYLFSPIYAIDGRLIAVDMIGRFRNASGKLSMPQDIVMSLLEHPQKAALLAEQLSVAKEKAAWFKQHDIRILLKIDPASLQLLLASESLKQELQSIAVAQLMINETFPDLSLGRNNSQLCELRELSDLWLDNFGIGDMHLKPFYDGLIDHVKIAPGQVWQLLSRPSSAMTMNTTLGMLKKYCRMGHVVAKGMDNRRYLSQIDALDVDAVQGQLWAAVPLERLEEQLLPAVGYG